MDNPMKGDIDFNIDYAKRFFSDNVVFRGTASGDDIAVAGSYSTVYAGGGSDRVSIFNAIDNVVYGEAGDDFIGTSNAQCPTIYGGKGNDSIRIDDADNFQVWGVVMHLIRTFEKI